jgi:hypothetical protein
MRRALSAVVVLTLVAGAAAMLAQTPSKPNFAGKWTLVPDPNAPAPAGRGRGMVGGLGQGCSVEQNDKTLTVVNTNQQMGEVKSVYNLDGSESNNPLSFNGQSFDRRSKVKWDGSKLVIATTSNFNGTPIETTQTWSLDATGNLMVETTSNVGGTPTTAKGTYKKG